MQGFASLPSLRVTSPDTYRGWFATHRLMLERRAAFHEPAWLEALDRASRGQLAIIGVYEGQSLVGALPGFLARRGPFRLFGSPLRKMLTSYLGPVLLPQAAASTNLCQLLDACEQFARRTWGVDYTEVTLRQAPAEDDLPGLAADWQPLSRSTYCLDLTGGEERLWAGFKSRCRGAIRKCEKLGLQVVPLLEVDLHAEILRQTFARRGLTAPYAEGVLASVLGLAAEGLVSGWGAEYDGRIIANGVMLHDDREVHFLTGGTLSEYRGVSGQTPLLWEAMKAGVRQGRRVFDFAGRGVAGIDEFKEAFGPEVVDYWSASRASRRVRLTERLVARCSRALGELEQLARSAGPARLRLGAPGWG